MVEQGHPDDCGCTTKTLPDGEEVIVYADECLPDNVSDSLEQARKQASKALR